jgi:4-carboxymuconolactone decarboxylase
MYRARADHDEGGGMSDEMYERGLEIRREVVGAEYVERSLKRTEEDVFGAEWQRIVTAFCWGESWSRDALSRRDRSLLNLAILGTLGRMEEFQLHVRGALRNGASRDEIEDTLIQLGIYAGVPAGIAAFRAAREVLAEEGQLG